MNDMDNFGIVSLMGKFGKKIRWESWWEDGKLILNIPTH